MTIARRVLVLMIVACAVTVPVSSGLSAPASSSHCAGHFPSVIHDGFPEPPMRFSHNGLLDTTLRAAANSIPINNHPVATLEYDGRLPAPTLVACPGDAIVVHLDNEMTMPTNLHVHGLHVSPQANGDNVFISVSPHQRFTYRYQLPANHPSGSYWYHPHLHMLVNKQIAGGLAGAIIIEGGLDNLLRNVPQRLMVIQGGLGNQSPRVPAPGPGPLLVNGVVNPSVNIHPGQIQRWRIFNATSFRILRLTLGGQAFQVLAEDGNTLRSARATTVLLIPPGSRREVLVRGGAAGRYALTAAPLQECFRSCLDPFHGIPPTGQATPPEPVVRVVSSGRAAHDRMPAGLLPFQLGDLSHSRVDVRRSITFSLMPTGMGPPAFPLNGMLFDPNRIDITMRLNSVEEWTLTNPQTEMSNEWHTFHIHQNPFQVMSINGKRLNYVDWEDNVALPPGARVVVRMRPTDFTGKFVLHCHQVFHEDRGMMAVVQVVKNLTRAQTRASRVHAGPLTITSSAYRTGPTAVAGTTGPR